MVSKKVGARARRARALATQTNYLAQLKAKLHPRRHGKGKTKIEGVFVKGARVEERTTIANYACKTCLASNSSQSLAKNHQKHA
jgi:hypothetical protein